MQETYQDCENMIMYHANRFRHYYDVEDLIQEGRKGLEKAKQKYKPGYDTKFSTFAFLYIKGEIYRYVREDKLIKYGKNYEKIAGMIERTRECLCQRLMREPTLEELSVFTELDTETIEDAIRSQELVRSLDYVINEDEDGKELQLYDTVAYAEKGYQEDILDLKMALEQLTEEERQIIEYRYYQGMTQQEISEKLGLNQVKISREEGKILHKLKTQLQEQ
ncbi:MAG: sigma-70 family RNA polymerase sigma factor [Bacilli bacterium]|nr:sigma-70 family RNA polymerase sigma factor [Bacilli bacterium]